MTVARFMPGIFRRNMRAACRLMPLKHTAYREPATPGHCGYTCVRGENKPNCPHIRIQHIYISQHGWSVLTAVTKLIFFQNLRAVRKLLSLVIQGSKTRQQNRGQGRGLRSQSSRLCRGSSRKTDRNNHVGYH